ncbi:hypothetical protein PUN28_000772 [Cardiocondyla obscurior]|uniref:Histone H3 n=1 Tax=Cardiocondyla obscurior TaxID=286306 RepID=A0AAW2H0Y2_9HYME
MSGRNGTTEGDAKRRRTRKSGAGKRAETSKVAGARKGIPDTKHAAFRNIVPAKRRRRRWRRATHDGRSSRRTCRPTLFLSLRCCFTVA